MDLIPSLQPSVTNYILCCQCGVQIEPNPSNMCVACLRSEVDISEGIPKSAVLYFCRKCERYLQPPDHWVTAPLESRELLSICLKRLKGLSKVRLIDAGFVWTEPHSMRIKVKLTVQKEVMNGAVLQQVFIVEFTITNQQCEACHRVEAKDYWRANVQIRQKAEHKKTFFYLEQLILKHKAHANTINIKPCHDGLDFFYTKKDQARKMVEFLTSVVPCKSQYAQELISHDVRNNVFNYKHSYSVTIVPVCKVCNNVFNYKHSYSVTIVPVCKVCNNVFNYKHSYSVTIVPVCKDNVVCLPKELAAKMGHINPICVVFKVTQLIHLIDPNTLQVAEVSGPVFWRSPFVSLCSPKQLVEYMVMDLQLVPDKEKPVILGQVSHKLVPDKEEPVILGQVSHKLLFNTCADKEEPVILGQVSHKLLFNTCADKEKPVILGQGYLHLLYNSFHGDGPAACADKEKLVILGQVSHKQYFCLTLWRHCPWVYADKKMRDRRRKWKLRHLNDELHNLETDSAMKYLHRGKCDPREEAGVPQISLQEMLDDLHLGDDATGDDGDPMMD
ncbi:hypothetical protein DPMN_070763 [Dreissena polymorpha]|uniref:60S ribosomal export protein NMD3 n=1 Tax=Dreissena polymorpha TaxID=45954 RepID=A0A9D3Z5W5_DREPO|nr:hypothetical protein DPMN_070763 [Dreissena polymorpha]